MQEDIKIWGIDKLTYDNLSSRHSKTNIFLWLIGGLVYNLFQGNLISISSLLIIIPGIFIASFASVITLWVNIQKIKILLKTENIFILIGFTVWYLIDLVYPIALSILFIKLVNFIV